MRLGHWSLVAALAAGAALVLACSSSTNVENLPYGIGCQAATATNGIGTGCLCGLSSKPNAVACDGDSVGGSCCAKENWPAIGSSYTSSSCTCEPYLPQTVICSAPLVSGPGTAPGSCTCSATGTGTTSSCKVATDGSLGVCCLSAKMDSCRCSATSSAPAPTCNSDETKVASCEASLFAPKDPYCSGKRVTSCTDPPFQRPTTN